MATAGKARGVGPERAYHRPLPASGVVRLDADEGRHLVRVRRARVGDPVALFDGLGATRLARLLDERAEGPSLEILSDYPDREPHRRVGVAVALSGAGRADDLVAALAECGVTVLVPLETARGVRDPNHLSARRRERWERLTREAAKVNGRSRLLRVEDPVEISSLPSYAAAASPPWTPVLLDTDPALPPLSRLLLGIVCPLLLVGPEGGFAPEEAAELARAGVPAGSLGACALRTETAAVAAAAIALGD